MKIIQQKDLKAGTVYAGILKGWGAFVWRCRTNGELEQSSWFLAEKRQFVNRDSTHSWNINRLATPEECIHLEQCIQAGKYIDYKKEELPKEWAIKVTEKNRGIISKARLLYGAYKNVLSGSIKDLWIINNKNGSIIGSSTSNGYTEITDDQFKRLVLKENNMEKKIIAYKLKKEMPLLPVGTQFDWNEDRQKFIVDENKETEHYYTLQEMSKLQDWFTPVYEEEFKVGDYVVDKLHEQEGAQQIMDEDKDSFNLSKQSWTYKKQLRKATPEEIRKAQEIRIDKYIVEYPGNGIAKIGCNEYTIDQIESLLSLMNSPNSSVNAIRVEGGIIVTKEQIQEIFDKFN